MLAGLLLLAGEARGPLAEPPRLPAPYARYVSTWRTRYSIDAVEVDFEDVQRQLPTLEVDEIRLGGDGWQIRWLMLKTRTAEKTKP